MKIINTYCPCYPTQAGCNGRILAVLTQDQASLYAVYVGIVKDWMKRDILRDTINHACVQSAIQHDKHEAEWYVAGSGEKLTYRNATIYFPTLIESEYRR